MKNRSLENSCWAIVMVSLLLCGTSCTTIPNQRFAAYRDASKATRAQAENVLADYAAARTEKQRRNQAKSGEANPLADLGLNAVLKLSPYSAHPPQPMEDAVAVRLSAWQVLEKYNEALAAVAAGVKTEEIAGSVDGFLGAVKDFPLEEVAELGAEAAPYAKVLTGLIELIEREVRARRFKAAVLNAAPRLERLNQVLMDDAERFYVTRLGLFREDYSYAVGDLVGLSQRFKELADSHPWNPAKLLNVEIVKVNECADVTGGPRLFERIPEIRDGGAVPRDQQAAELRDAQSIATQISERAEGVRTVLRETQAYRGMMDQYAALLAGFKLSQTDLVRAVERSSNQLPSLERIQQAISNVRLAHEIYRSTK